ncbi:HAD-IA family hydrolase [uncultured Hyphomicrobium sp.]|uniref:HAD family hydrolase n=1 Tax=uncultured Hyphomicrobium sp. TaxID=194373 RepID=UPI0025F42520|nr:HAD-IA family hydrolase [uncultured Hyphomicrobium sp.]
MQHVVTPTVVFDLDGTLVDTVPDIAAALDAALARYPSSCATSAREAAAMMGDGLTAFFWRALVAKRLHLEAEEATDALHDFLAAYRRSPATLSRLYPGIRSLLAELTAAGVHTAVCTNKVEPIALQILDQLGVLKVFDAVVGHRDDRPKKPDPFPLVEAIDRAGGSKHRALMIGDSEPDSRAAAAIGIPVILVSYGYCPVPVRTLTATHHVDDARELRSQILQLISTSPDAPLSAH